MPKKSKGQEDRIHRRTWALQPQARARNGTGRFSSQASWRTRSCRTLEATCATPTNTQATRKKARPKHPDGQRWPHRHRGKQEKPRMQTLREHETITHHRIQQVWVLLPVPRLPRRNWNWSQLRLRSKATRQSPKSKVWFLLWMQGLWVKQSVF